LRRIHYVAVRTRQLGDLQTLEKVWSLGMSGCLCLARPKKCYERGLLSCPTSHRRVTHC
jgi:hypothetical protein